MVAVIEIERRVVNVAVFCIILLKLGHSSKSGPIIILKLDKSLKIDLYNTI